VVGGRSEEEHVLAAPYPSFGSLEPLGGGDPIPLVKERIVVGRRETNDVCLPFQNVSNRHCELILEQGYWKVRDLQSTNGVKVNCERVQEKRVYPGDELAISKHRFRLEYTPTTARSADAEVDELHEDIMRFSLLERAGLTKHGDRSTESPRRPKRPANDDDNAMDRLNIPVAQSDQGDANDSRPSKSSLSVGEEAVEAVSPSTSAHDLSDEEFLKIVAEEERKKKATPKKPS
jgi:pSer/pThr/pTyr-binding forkhead associated (FHA) protein